MTDAPDDSRCVSARHGGGLTVVPIDESAPTLSAGQARPLFEDLYRLDPGTNYDISRDGQRFVFVEESRSTKPARAQRPQLQLVLNWFEELKRLVPTK
jgi:hypothetical protein